MKRLMGLIVLLALLTGIAAGCAQTPPENRSTPESASSAPEKAGWPRTITDAAGHEVVLEKQPERITLLHTFYMEHFLLLDTPPTASSIGNALGQTEALQQSEMFGPFLKDVEIMNLGSASEINLETILESDPDVIVTFSTQGGAR
ncbi:MAG: hypothetical protein E6593_01415 [Clostridium sp.]|nr:hypothetical protein [Clostridium sp.]